MLREAHASPTPAAWRNLRRAQQPEGSHRPSGEAQGGDGAEEAEGSARAGTATVRGAGGDDAGTDGIARGLAAVRLEGSSSRGVG